MIFSFGWGSCFNLFSELVTDPSVGAWGFIG
jgi:hypothetical protein